MLRIQRTRKEEKKVQRKYSICVNGREIVKTSTKNALRRIVTMSTTITGIVGGEGETQEKECEKLRPHTKFKASHISTLR